MRAERKIFMFDGVFAKMVKYICDRSVSIAEKNDRWLIWSDL